MIGKMLGKRYELVEKIGEGGMGLVYKARCHLLNRYVAVKILKPELTGDEGFINKFRKESLSAASLSHPNIVNIYDVGMEDGIYYIVMEYVRGKTLKEIISDRAPLAYNEIINISRQICLALDHAHNNNIIHRDVKPQNIIITHDGIVKVADFGIARASDSATLTNTGNVLGSVYYISPEQARGGYTDAKTDVYSLGTVMYEMATAKVPFMADSPVVIALKHIQETVMKPSELNPSIPVALEDIILKSLEKNPELRYESASMLIKDLDRAFVNPGARLASKRKAPDDATRVMPVLKVEDKHSGKNRRNKGIKKGVNKGWIAALVIIFTTAIVAGIFMYMSGLRTQDVPIPNILGRDEQVAKDMLKADGLSMQVVSRPNDEQHPKGIVISAYPQVGMMVKQNSIVKVTVSAGPRKVTVPNIVESSLTDAIFKLQENGLDKGEVKYVSDEKIEKDRVVKQSPKGGTEAEYGSKVDIYVSSGPDIKLTNVPMLEGVSFEIVEERVREARLELGPVQKRSDHTKPDKIVLFQSIPQGTQVPEGSQINIIVNDISSSIPATS